jgi:putative flippase GtrA
MPPVRALATTLVSEHGRRFAKYCSVSVLNVVLGQALLLSFHSILGWPGWMANLAAIFVGTGPAYLISRRWVWEKTGRHSLSAEVLPFWGLNLFGTVLSTLFVGLADVIWNTPVAISGASITAWFFVWVLKYLTMDRVVFRDRTAEPAATVS